MNAMLKPAANYVALPQLEALAALLAAGEALAAALPQPDTASYPYYVARDPLTAFRKALADARDATEQPAFRVVVMPMKESHQSTFWTYLERGDRPVDTPFYSSEGRMTPFKSTDVAEANYDAAEWAQFLGVPFTPCATPATGL